jgi:undecaprenyl-diphosphatase
VIFDVPREYKVMDNSAVGTVPAQPSLRRVQAGPWILPGTALVLFLLLGALIHFHDRPYFEMDLAVTRAVQAAAWPGIDDLMHAVSWAGDDLRVSMTMVAGVCLLLAAFRRRREAAILLGVVLVGQVLKIGIKHLVDRPRPAEDLVQVLIHAKEHQSYPSGHTEHYTVFFGFLFVLTWVLVKAPALRLPLLAVFAGLVLLVGPARIYLGAHWASDIVGGYLLGSAVLAAGINTWFIVPREVRNDKP